MTDTHDAAGSWRAAGEYEIRLDGHLDQRWVAWLDGLTLVRESDGTTVLRGRFADQAALHGLLNKVRDLALPLISVAQVPSAQVPSAPLDAPPRAR